MLPTRPAALVFGLLGCAPADPVAPTDMVEPCTDCVVLDAHNYSIASTLEAEVHPLQALSDAEIDWSGLHTDVQGHPVEPDEIDRVMLVAFPELEPEQVMEGLASDTLTQSEAAIYVLCEPEPGVTTCRLSEFSILGSSFDVESYFLPSVKSWLVVPSTGGQQGARSFAFLKASEDSDESVAIIDDETARLSVEVDLTSLQPLVVPPGEADLHLDWTGLSQDGLGNPLQPRTLDRLFVARYDEDPSTLEQRIFDLESSAEETWSLSLSGGTEAMLGDLEGVRPFPGIDDQGTWLLALRCSTCIHPAPRFMTVLRPPGRP